MRLFTFSLFLTFSLQSQAYYSTMDTADLVSEGMFNSNLETQFITDGDSGANLIGHFDGRLTEDSGYRVELGFGVVDFQVGAFYKWNPIPDTENQPAMSILGGISVARVEFEAAGVKESANDLSLRVHPIISKKLDSELGLFTPYASLPVGLQTVEGDSEFTVQITLGTKLKTEKFENISFMGEVGFDISEAFTYFSLGVNLAIDPDRGLEFN